MECKFLIRSSIITEEDQLEEMKEKWKIGKSTDGYKFICTVGKPPPALISRPKLIRRQNFEKVIIEDNLNNQPDEEMMALLVKNGSRRHENRLSPDELKILSSTRAQVGETLWQEWQTLAKEIRRNENRSSAYSTFSQDDSSCGGEDYMSDVMSSTPTSFSGPSFSGRRIKTLSIDLHEEDRRVERQEDEETLTPSEPKELTLQDDVPSLRICSSQCQSSLQVAIRNATQTHNHLRTLSSREQNLQGTLDSLSTFISIGTSTLSLLGIKPEIIIPSEAKKVLPLALTASIPEEENSTVSSPVQVFAMVCVDKEDGTQLDDTFTHTSTSISLSVLSLGRTVTKNYVFHKVHVLQGVMETSDPLNFVLEEYTTRGILSQVPSCILFYNDMETSRMITTLDLIMTTVLAEYHKSGNEKNDGIQISVVQISDEKEIPILVQASKCPFTTIDDYTFFSKMVAETRRDSVHIIIVTIQFLESQIRLVDLGEVKDRMINQKSLFAIQDVMRALSTRRTHVPYRNAYITKMLRTELSSSLGPLFIASISLPKEIPEASTVLSFTQSFMKNNSMTTTSSS